MLDTLPSPLQAKPHISAPSITKEIMSTTLYFAYGSNMNHEQFRKRCPNSTMLAKAILQDYRFVITSSGYASIVPDAGAKVVGILCALSPKDECTLDAHEGARWWQRLLHCCAYTKETVNVIVNLSPFPCMAYVDTQLGIGKAHAGYMDKVILGARQNNLPGGYLDILESWK